VTSGEATTVGSVWRAVRARIRAVVLATADRAGEVTRSIPGAAGALMLSWGLGQMYRPLLWVSLGLFALAIDRRMP
jgi:hypothetical protein